MSTPLKTRNIDFTRQTYRIASHDQRTHSPNVLQCRSPVVAHFDVRGAAAACLKLRDKRTLRGHRLSVAFDPKPTSAGKTRRCAVLLDYPPPPIQRPRVQRRTLAA